VICINLCREFVGLRIVRSVVSATGKRELGSSLKDIESLAVKLALKKSPGEITAAAQLLEMSRAQMSYLLRGK